MLQGAKSFGLFNFKDDLTFQHNLVNERVDIVKDMEPKLKAFIQQYTNRMATDSLTVVDQF